MKAKLIYEKFKEEFDPIHDLGIGYGKLLNLKPGDIIIITESFCWKHQKNSYVRLASFSANTQYDRQFFANDGYAIILKTQVFKSTGKMKLYITIWSELENAKNCAHNIKTMGYDRSRIEDRQLIVVQFYDKIEKLANSIKIVST